MRLASLLLVLCFLGCSSSDPVPPDTTCSCDGRICGSVCGGKVCGVCPDDGVCEAEGTRCRAAKEIGASCTEDLQCGTGRMCLEKQAPGGYCSRSCSDSNPCPAGSQCGFSPLGDRVCLVSCEPARADGCRAAEGYQCSAGVCAACVGVCDGRSCGDDGCGGSCGECDDAGALCSSGACASLFNHVASLPLPERYDFPTLDLKGDAVLVGGREVVPGPNGSLSTRGLKKVLKFKRATNTFETLADLPELLVNAHAAVLDDVIYIAGGTIDPDVRGAPDVASSHVWRQGGIWVQQQSEVPEPSMNGAFVNVDGRLFLLAGETSSGPSDRMDEYDPVQDRWSAAPARPTKRTRFAAVSDGLRLFVLGGWDGTRTLKTVEIFDPATGWAPGPDLPVAVADATAVVAQGRIFLFGGFDGPGVGDIRPVVQSVELATRRTQVLGVTWNTLIRQSPVRVRDGALFLFGGFEYAAANTPKAHGEVLQLSAPAP